MEILGVSGSLLRGNQQGRFYTSIVAEVEGFRPTFYSDNQGYAIGFGYNASFQTRPTNERVGRDILGDAAKAEAIASLTGKFSVPTLPIVRIDADQGLRIAELIRPQYQDPMKKWFNGFDQLKPHQQAVLAYHCFKVGPGGAVRYAQLKAALERLVKEPNEKNTLDAAAHFTYKYRLNGQMREDTRSSVFMQALFINPDTYADLINGQASKTLSSVPAFKPLGIDANTPENFDRIPDPIGAAKVEMEVTGRRIEIKPLSIPSQTTGYASSFYRG